MSEQSSKWIDIGALESVPIRGARVVKSPTGCIAVFRTAENEVYAIDDKCPHKGGPLSQGIVHGRSVTCPLHNWVIDLTSGDALGADKGHVRTFALRVEGGRILLDASVLRAAQAA